MEKEPINKQLVYMVKISKTRTKEATDVIRNEHGWIDI
jgi:hypothetical protein